MTTAAEQYRALVAKLEQINEDLKIGDIDPSNGKKILSALTASDGSVIRSGSGDIWNVKYGDPDPTPAPTPAEEPVGDITPRPPVNIPPESDPTPTPGPAPAPEEKCGPEVKEKIKQQKTFNAAYAMAKQAGCADFDWCQIVTVPEQGGKPEDKWFSAPGMGKGSVVTKSGNPQFSPIAEEDNEFRETLNAMRRIAGLKEAAGIPEINAGTKEAAIAIARKKGIKQFRFCSKFKVQAGKPGPHQGPKELDMAPSAAAVGNPNISRSTAPGNPNIRPGSLRDRAAQANAARRPDAPRFN